MCSIIGSFSSNNLKKLIELNEHRGNFSYSYSEFKENEGISFIDKDFGCFPPNLIDERETKLAKLPKSSGPFKISHLQAPTGGLIKDKKRIHPTKIGESYLWHNGLITPRGMRNFKKIGIDEGFDTLALHSFILIEGFENLSQVEGLFSCLLVKDNKVFIFRTKHGKLYIDEDMNISSEKFEGSLLIPFDTIIELDLNKKILIKRSKFKTKRFNYQLDGDFEL